jgi:hypothetical protein
MLGSAICSEGDVVKLIHRTGTKPGMWEIKWVWLPWFVSTNPAVVSHVAKGMTEKFKDRSVENGLEQEMHDAVISLICEKVQFPGLKQYLEAVSLVELEEPAQEERE